MRLDVGRAASFAKFNSSSNTLIIEKGGTTNSTAGSYLMTLTLRDDGSNDTSTSTRVYTFNVYIKCRPILYENTDANKQIDYNTPKVESTYNCGYSIPLLPLMPSNIPVIGLQLSTETSSPALVNNTSNTAITNKGELVIVFH